MRRDIFLAVFVLVIALSSHELVFAASDWQQIDVPDSFVDRNGITRQPGCSGAPQLTAGGIIPSDTKFSFFIREGDAGKLLIALDGGGACWETNTCIGSALAGNPVYEPVVNETPESLADIGGLGDITNPGNPLSDFTQVFVPYCTGDIHWGSRDTEYFYTLPDNSQIAWTIHHRGFDNNVAVLEWLLNYYQTVIGAAPDKVVLAGTSAGGYGVLLALPALKQILPLSTRTYLLADSANGVVNEEFYDTALGGYDLSGGNWGIEQNIPDFLLTAFSSGPEAMSVATYAALAGRYPLSRYGQYTRAWDGVQIFYYNVMQNIDYPERWSDPAYLLASAIPWSTKARTDMQLSAMAFNYRFYIAAGTEHGILPDDGFYTENSAQGLYFRDWVDDMVNQQFLWQARDWLNASCSPNCR
ncbi:MAG: pectinacetylesterase family protein [Gammaproteobacteria bacterium]|nr:pectinacetylesterase family protein [Gammaproteobacteria bacterium]